MAREEMLRHTPGISVVVPVYNGASTLRELVTRLEMVLPVVADRYEVLLVNDASPDESWEILRELAQSHDSVQAINFMRNYGQHSAVLCGIRAAQYEVVVTMDDDLQHPPEEIPRLMEKLGEGCDVVYGTPIEPQHGFWRNLTSQVTKLVLQETMGAEVARQVSAFRAFRLNVRDAFAHFAAPFVCIDVLLTWGTSRFAAIPVHIEPRRSGKSGYTFRKLVAHAMTMMTGFSTLPLQLASIVGFAFTLLGFVVLMFVLVRYIVEGGSVPGFPFLASIVAIFSGAQLFALGMMGEYLARMHFRILDRPSYSVREVVARQLVATSVGQPRAAVPQRSHSERT
jgi:undecaprenyl-phosphate 4-deoxy-4-formamido-L-arabinose transferase